MTKHLLLTVILIQAIHFSSGQDLYKQDLAGLAAINFPSKPAVVDTLGQKVYSCSDQTANYIVVINDMSKQTDFQLREGKLDGFYEGAAEGIISASKGKLISRKWFDLNGLRGMDIEFTSTANPSLPDLRFAKILFFNKTFFMVNFWTLSGNKLSTQTERNRYFNSFAVTAGKEKTKQFTLSEEDHLYNMGYKAGRVLGGFIVIGIIIGFIFLLTFAVRKVAK